MTQDVLKLALEALEAIGSQYVCRSTHHTKAQQHHGFEMCPNELTHEAAITALREALAQPDYRAVKTYHEGKPVYVAQPQQEPVAWICYGAPGKRDIDFEEADINGLPIGTSLYTSPPQPQPEQNLNCKSTQARLATAWGFTKVLDISDKRLMKMPPQREWVGLTDEEVAYFSYVLDHWTTTHIRGIEAKLREKNK